MSVNVKIISVETQRVSQVVKRDLAIVSAAGAQPESHFVVVNIRADDGHVGFGEASVVPVWSGESQAGALAMIKDLLGPLLIGKNPLHIAALTEAMDRCLIGNPFTKAGLEMALLDLAGKILGVPAHILLGGPRRPPALALKFSIGAFPPAQAAHVALRAAEMGLRAAKVKVGFDVSGDIARLEAVRAAVGPDFPVAVDANSGWRECDVLAALPALERLGVNALEQPLRRGDFMGCARIRRHTSIPLMLDESVFTPQDAMEAIRMDACDLISIYPGKNGGVLRSLEIAQMAANAGIQCTIGSNLEMDLGSAAMLQVAVAAPALATTVGHDIVGPLYYERHFTRTPITYRNGCAVVPEGPGLGIEFDNAGDAN